MLSVTFKDHVRNEFGLFAKGDTIRASKVEDDGKVSLDYKQVPAVRIHWPIPGAPATEPPVSFRVPKSWVTVK